MKPTSHNFSGATRARRAGFTMIEIAICLAVIGIALVAIVGVLPIGLNAQRESREATVVGQDATVLLEAIRSGARGLDDLTNYVIAITNYQAMYNNNAEVNSNVFAYTYSTVSALSGSIPSYLVLTNGANIIGLLSTPLFTDTVSKGPTNNLANGPFFSNHIVAYFHSISGPVTEKPPQDNQILIGDSFGYRVVCENSPAEVPDFLASPKSYNHQIAYNRNEVRMTFGWPLLPNGKISTANQPLTFRATVSGPIMPDPGYPGWLYYYQSQIFTNAP